MWKALGHIYYDLSHYDRKENWFLGDLSQVFLNRIFWASAVCREDDTLKVRAVSGAFQRIFGEPVVTYSAHSMERFQTSLAEYWVGGREGAR